MIQVWEQKAFFDGQLAQDCGGVNQKMKWDLASTDVDHDGVRGVPMVDGPFKGFNANFNLINIPIHDNATDDNNFTM